MMFQIQYTELITRAIRPDKHLLQGLDVVHRDEVQLHELDYHLLEGALSQQLTLHPRI